MKKRPESVTYLAVFIIALNAIALCFNCISMITISKDITDYGSVSSLVPPDSITYLGELLWYCTSGMLMVIAGTYMLKGENWARFLFVILSFVTCGINFISRVFGSQELLFVKAQGQILSRPQVAVLGSIVGFLVLILFVRILFSRKSNAYFYSEKAVVIPKIQ